MASCEQACAQQAAAVVVMDALGKRPKHVVLGARASMQRSDRVVRKMFRLDLAPVQNTSVPDAEETPANRRSR